MSFHCPNEDEYINKINSLKELVKSYNDIKNNYYYKLSSRIKGLLNLIKKDNCSFPKNFKSIISYLKDYIAVFFKIRKHNSKMIEVKPANYFTEHKIAVYTCVFGDYDEIPEPITQPDNIDYYIISDSNKKSNSCWKYINIKDFKNTIQYYSNVEKNRWFKMHPFEVFPNYKYTIYIDGNIKPITDFTEFVNRIGKAGIAMYNHKVNCVYIEALLNHHLIKKISSIELENHIKYLKEKGMPENFGMTTCNVIARDRDNKICRKLMSDWWNEFMSHCKRDQISFPYVVWKNNLKITDIALLGNDVWNADTLQVIPHKK